MTVIQETELAEIAGGNTQQDLVDFVERLQREWQPPAARSPFEIQY